MTTPDDDDYDVEEAWLNEAGDDYDFVMVPKSVSNPERRTDLHPERFGVPPRDR